MNDFPFEVEFATDSNALAKLVAEHIAGLTPDRLAEVKSLPDAFEDSLDELKSSLLGLDKEDLMHSSHRDSIDSETENELKRQLGLPLFEPVPLIPIVEIKYADGRIEPLTIG
jgi:hypothetical protein